jgi:hypothetical protein
MYEAYCNKPIQYYNNYLYKNNISFQLKILEELNKIGITYSKDLINLNFEHNIDFIKKNLIKKKSILFNKEEELLILLTFITKEEDKNFISRLLEIIDYNSFRDNVIPYLNTIVLKEKKLSIVSNIKTNATLKKKINENTFTTNDIETLLNCHKKKNLVSLNSSNSEYDQFNNNQREADMMSYLSGKYTILEYERNKKDMFIFLALFKETDVFRYKCFFDTRLRQNILGLHNYIGSKLLRYCSFLKHDKKKFLPIKSYNDKNIYYIFYLMNQIQTYNSLEESYKNFDEDLINNLDKLDKSKFNSYANLIKIQKYQSHSTV